MYYVYELVDPRDGKVFYVGKGKGDRLNRHEKQAREGQPGPRFDYIRSLTAVDLEPGKRVIERFNSEKDAYRAEATRIAYYGIDSLTNVKRGGDGQPRDTQWRHDRDWARVLIMIAVKTRVFQSPQTFTLGGESHPVPDEFFVMCRREWVRILRTRGREWVVSMCHGYQGLRVN